MMNPSVRGGVTAASAAVLAAAVFFGTGLDDHFLLISGVLAIAVALFAAGWPRLLGVPAQRGATVVIGAAGLAALVVVALTKELSALPLVIALAVVLAFAHQMARTDGRPRLIESLSATVSGVIVAVLSAGWAATITHADTHPDARPNATALILVAACALTAGTLGTAFGRRRFAPVLATVLAGAAGAIVGWLFPSIGPWAGLATGAGLGVFQSGLHIMFGLFPASRRVRPALSAALLPVLASGIVVYMIARAVAMVDA